MARLAVALLLAAMVALAGCGSERPGRPAPAPPAQTAPAPTQTVPPPTLSPGATLVSALPRLMRVAGGYHQFEVSAQQYEIIGKNVYQVLFREGLWDQGVRFGANYLRDKNLHFVLIDPGFSHLSAREILDRLLGIA
jgi:hypothetical protein